MNKYLNKPFPVIERKSHRIIASFLFSLFVFVFLLVFQPFGLDDIQFYKSIFIAGYFFITLFVLLIRFFIAPAIFTKFHDADSWTVKKNLLSILYVIIIITILNWIYSFWIGKEIVEQYSLFSFLLITISVGFFPTILLVILVEKFLTKKHNKIAQNITSKIQLEEKSRRSKRSKIINILSENVNEEIIIELDQLICIKSESNYAVVYFFENNKISKQLIRNSLTKLMQQLIIFDNIKRCHRSYIVNFSYVVKISGNARNYNLHIENLDFSVPVSRNFPKSTLYKHSN